MNDVPDFFQFLANLTLHEWAFILLNPNNTMGNQTSMFMTNHESKLVKKLERRLKDHVLHAKNTIHRQIEPKGVGATPIRMHQPMIQRAQFYTGDA